MQQLNASQDSDPAQQYQHALWKAKVILLRVGVELSHADLPGPVAELFGRFDVHQVNEPRALQDQLDQGDAGCFLLEYAGDDASLADTIEAFLPQVQGASLVVLARAPSVAQAVMAIRMGATDYIDGSIPNAEQIAAALLESVQQSVDAKIFAEAAESVPSFQQSPLALVSEATPYGAYSVDAAHSVLTPLSALQEFVTLVLDGVAGPIGEEQGKYLAYARGACDQIRQAVDQFVGVNGRNPKYFATPTSQELGPILLEAWSTLNSSTSEQDLRLELDEAVSTQLVCADPILLLQLFRTLLQDLTAFAEPGEAINVVTQFSIDNGVAELKVSLCSEPTVLNNREANRTFSNQRQFGPWLVTETLEDGLSYQLDLPAVIQSEHVLSTKDNEET